MYRDPSRPPPVGVTVGGNGGDALSRSHPSHHFQAFDSLAPGGRTIM
jgi:hypothetical protein